MQQNGNSSSNGTWFDSSMTELPDYDMNPLSSEKLSWVTEDTAIMVVHGIGHQKQNETLDMFARGLLEKYQLLTREKLYVSHHIKVHENGKASDFQNLIRLNHPDSEFHIDVYEYYWAYCTEDKSSLSEINAWLHGVVQGAKKFYDRNKQLGEKYGDSSQFFKDGRFVSWKYSLFLNFFVKFYLLVNGLVTLSLKLISFIPVIGSAAESMLKDYMGRAIYKLTNLLGDIVIYNVSDEKSKFFCVRQEILEGAVSSLQNLLERTEDEKLTYPAVIVAGHSLGSQIAYDALNRINLLTNLGQLKYYHSDGTFKSYMFDGALPPIHSISDQIKGFITFGSPLDKIVFFLRENIPDEQYLRQQITDSYNCFKQRDWTESTFAEDKKIETSIRRLLDDIPWYNYYDNDDMISGGLDYFMNVRNICCNLNSSSQFMAKKKKFTHGHYWGCRNFYEDIIRNLLSRRSRESILPSEIMMQAN